LTVGAAEVVQQHQHHPDGVFGDGVLATLGAVENGNTFFFSVVEVYVVGPHPPAGNEPEARAAGIQQFAVDVEAATHHQTVEIFQYGENMGAVAGAEVGYQMAGFFEGCLEVGVGGFV